MAARVIRKLVVRVVIRRPRWSRPCGVVAERQTRRLGAKDASGAYVATWQRDGSGEMRREARMRRVAVKQRGRMKRDRRHPREIFVKTGVRKLDTTGNVRHGESRIIRTARLVAWALAATGALSGVSATAQPPLFLEAEGLPGTDEVDLETARVSIDGEPDRREPDPGLPSRNVRVHIDRLGELREQIAAHRERPQVLLNLFEGVAFRAVFEHTAPTSSGYSLSGRLEDVRWGTVTLVVNGDIVA